MMMTSFFLIFLNYGFSHLGRGRLFRFLIIDTGEEPNIGPRAKERNDVEIGDCELGSLMFGMRSRGGW